MVPDLWNSRGESMTSRVAPVSVCRGKEIRGARALPSVSPEIFEIWYANRYRYILVLFGVIGYFFGGGGYSQLWRPSIFYWMGDYTLSRDGASVTIILNSYSLMMMMMMMTMMIWRRRRPREQRRWWLESAINLLLNKYTYCSGAYLSWFSSKLSNTYFSNFFVFLVYYMFWNDSWGWYSVSFSSVRPHW